MNVISSVQTNQQHRMGTLHGHEFYMTLLHMQDHLSLASEKDSCDKYEKEFEHDNGEHDSSEDDIKHNGDEDQLIDNEVQL